MRTSEANKISILEAIKGGNFEASIVTTFNAYLPYYEEVFLNCMQSAGCRHNVLLMDDSQFSKCLETPALRPRLAGYNYSIIPISSKGAFHPKIILLISRKKGLLFIGSHNMTISGMGLNSELTTRIDILSGKQSQGIPLARDVWQFVENWINFTTNQLPEPLLKAFYAIKRFAPWLHKTDEPIFRDIKFIGSDPAGDQLWKNVSNMVDGPVRKIWVLGPFFDQKFKFIKQLYNELHPEQFIIGIDPATALLPDLDYRTFNFKFVDASKMQDVSGYLHAKATYIETTSGKSWLITGSANPSKNAWTSEPSQRNAEAVVVYTNKLARDTAYILGLNQIEKMPEIDSDGWTVLRERVKKDILRNQKPDKTPPYKIGVAGKKRISISGTKIQPEIFVKANCLDGNSNIIKTYSSFENVRNTFCIPVEKNLSKIRFVEIFLKGTKRILCLIHHDAEITRRSVSSRQAQFRRTISSLQSENPDLEKLIRTVEKIIFEEPFEIDPSAKRKKNNKKHSTESEPIKEITTLSVSLNDTKREKRRKRLVTSGDIGHLLDVLIHHLGIGLDREIEGIDHKGRSEEELAGTDDEENEKVPFLIDMPKMVKICNGKVRRLITRMIKTFEKVSEQNAGYDQCLMKLLAVLAILRELRALDYKLEGIPYEQSLFPEKERVRLLNESLKYLYGADYRFLAKVKDQLVNSPWDEISRLHGILFWLAHDCGADFRHKKVFNESIRNRKIRFRNKSYLLLVTPNAVTDPISLAEAIVSINRTTYKFQRYDKLQWINKHQFLGDKLDKLRKKAHIVHSKITKKPRIGQLAFVRGKKNPTFHVVLQSTRYITLSDIGSKDGKAIYPIENVAAINFP